MKVYFRSASCFLFPTNPVSILIRNRPVYSLASKMAEINGELVPANCVLARQYAGAPAVELSFRFSDTDIRERVVNFTRLLQEPLSATILRMQININGKRKKPKKGVKHATVPESVQSGGGEACNSVQIRLFDRQRNPVDETTLNELCWCEGNTMEINETCYEISKNPPMVRRLTLPKTLLTQLPAFPVRFAVDFCNDEPVFKAGEDEDENLQSSTPLNEHLCRFYWLREQTRSMPAVTVKTPVDISMESAETQNLLNEKGWQIVSNERFYYSSTADEGRALRLVVVPVSLQGKVGGARMITSTGVVQKAPVEDFPFERRKFECASDLFASPTRSINQIKVLSYNILADLYADTEAARTELFHYCPAEYRSMDYRQRVFLRELAHYNCDLICLQEVDTRVFLHALTPFLRVKFGMQGLLKTKFNVAEGCATFFRTDMFRFVRSHDVIISEMVQTEPSFSELKEKIDADPSFSARFWNRTSALQVTLLEHKRTQRLYCVANTHLFFEPDADDVRLMQMGACLTFVDNIVHASARETGKMPVMLFCGDFNSTNEMGTHELLRTGLVTSDNPDWQSARAGGTQSPTAAAPFTTEFSHSLKLDTACGVPAYTNFTAGFKDTLDWIYYDTNALAVTNVLSMPTIEECTRHVALPSCEFPSDHIAIGCTLQILDAG